MLTEHFADLKPDRQERIERRHRLLKNHRHVPAANRLQLVVRKRQQISTREPDAVGRDRRKGAE